MALMIRKKAFTLIEVLVSMAIISIVITMVIASIPKLLKLYSVVDNSDTLATEIILVSRDLRYADNWQSRIGGKTISIINGNDTIKYLIQNKELTREYGNITHKLMFDGFEVFYCHQVGGKECKNWRKKTTAILMDKYKWWKVILIEGKNHYPIIIRGY